MAKKVLIVDDHAVVRSGIRLVLEKEDFVCQVGEAADAHEALQQLQEQSWDVVLLDINLPDMSGLELLKEIRRSWPDLPVLVISMHAEGQYALRALRAGAAGYLTKGTEIDEMIGAIARVAGGRRYITPAVAERMADEIASGTAAEPHTLLSDREYQVFSLIASGKTLTKVAEEMGLSVKTVSTYRSRILSKIGMKTNAELTHYAVKQGLVF